jgi:hypothetical protein
MKVEYQIIYWRDIPAQLRLRRGRQRLSHPLPPQFQQTVYRAAYRAKAITGEGFEEGWRPGPWVEMELEVGLELEEVAAAVAEALVAEYDEGRLNGLALGEGVE